MKISELVEDLERLKEIRGDIDVWVLNSDWNVLCYPQVIYEQRSGSAVVKPEDK